MATVALSGIITPSNVVTATSTTTLTNKTISGASNTLTNIPLATAVTGNLPVTNLNSGTSASASTFWRGDGAWGAISAGFTLATPVASTSGTSIDFTGIPAGVKQIVVTYKGVSTSSTSEWRIQIGDSGGIETSGYSSRSVAISGNTVTNNDTTGGYIILATNADSALSGSVTLTLENATTFSWVGVGTVGDPDTGKTIFTSGVKSLSAQLTQVRITTQNGTDTFDAGEVNIAYI